MSPAVTIQRNAPIATVVLSRRSVKNAVDRATAEALAAAFRELDQDDTIAASVLFGDHGTFCSGADLKAVAAGSGAANRLEPDGDGPMGPTRMTTDKPVIAAIAGHAVAGGLELALWCDLRVAEPDAVLGVFCRRWGVPLIDGGTVRLPHIVGLSRALDLILTGRAVAAQEAHAIGLINRISAAGKVREEAEALAHQLARFPQMCLRSDRAAVYEGLGHSPVQALAIEFEHGRRALNDPALLAGATRFSDGAGRHGSFDD
ncbi:MAG: crotonase/enoyl-CoA hydratase family protein [Nannocystaceae bacterium]|nr:crotonase/enoyl-CoA hydratase family protein [Nannocystaceae bacterium]